MIHNDIQNQLALLIKTSATPLIDVAQSSTESPQWVPGQRLPAYVIASLPNGRFHVTVEDQTLDLNLPRSTQPGDALELVYVSDKPRPTFALLSDLAKALPSSSNNVNLSQAGKFLGALLQQGSAANTAPITHAEPVVPGAPTSVPQLATALRDTISQSGLFYESHQAQWVSGERTLENLLHEPQAKLSAVQPDQKSPTVAVAEKVTSDNAAQATPVRANGLPDNATPSNSVIKSTLDSSQQALGLSSSSTSVRDPVHPATAPIVQQQLNVLDSRQIVWQGQVWPGQEMKWEIEEEEHRQQHGEAEEGAVWRTRMYLNFPALGGVTAHLALGAGGVKVDFSVERESSATLMQTEAASLVQSMESSGLRVAGLLVRQDGNS